MVTDHKHLGPYAANDYDQYGMKLEALEELSGVPRQRISAFYKGELQLKANECYRLFVGAGRLMERAQRSS